MTGHYLGHHYNGQERVYLFPVSVMEAEWVKNSVRVLQSPCLHYIDYRQEKV